MNSRERLLGAVYRRPIDRVPISTYELVGWNSAAWENSEPSYHALMDIIREQTDCIFMTGVRRVAKTDEASVVESRTWVDGGSHFTETTWHTPRGDLRARHRVDESVHTRWALEYPLKSIDDIDKYLSMPWEPSEVDMSDFEAQRLSLGDRGVMMLSVSDPICAAADLFGMTDLLVHALTEPDRLLYLMDAIHERQMHELAQILRHEVRDVQFRIVGPEYATPPYLSPHHFHRYVTRYLGEIGTAIRDAGGFVRVHCHGKIAHVLNQIVESGAQGLDPIEPPPDGDIGLGEVKRRYGRDLCLFGNIELRELERSEPDRIDALVRTAMEQAKEGGGFVLMPTAAPINVPLSPKTERNYRVFIEAGLKYGRY